MNMHDTTRRDAEARAILTANDRGGYTVPTAGLYPFQWNWDSAFAALGFAGFDIDRAWRELETLMSGQWESGMVPHILFHKPDDGYFPGPDIWGGTGPIPSSGITQPPVAMTAARLIFERDPQAGRDRAAALFPGLMRWLGWFMDWRLDRGAVCNTHPWEAGRDNAPDWDASMAAIDPAGVGPYTRRDTGHVDASMRPTKHDYDRYIWLVNQGRDLGWDDAALRDANPFRVADPTMTFILLRGARDLVALGRALDLDTAAAEAAIPVLEAGAETLWNPGLGCYDARDVRGGSWAGAVTNASFLCWYAGIDRAEMAPLLARVMDGVEYGVPSLVATDPRFDALRYWRGPTWGFMNMMIGTGLDEHGLPLGTRVRETTRRLIGKHGFAEYFDPMTGAPAGGKSFTWTAAVWLEYANREGA